MLVDGERYRTVWMEDGVVEMIEQRDLPDKFHIIELRTAEDVAEAISRMSTRGAGAIGGSAGYGMALSVMNASEENFEEDVEEAAEKLRKSRPTAQDLFYAVDRVLDRISEEETVEEKRKAAADEAESIADDNVESARKIGEYGNELIEDGYKILTHCNAGWLAFVDWGSALSPIYRAKRAGKELFVWVDETRPRCQGSRLTAWELANEKIDHRVIVDNAAGHYMRKGKVDMVIVGADRVARNGDVANKIGTYEKAVVARENGIPFYVAAPTSTIDLNSRTGDDIPIEERGEEEVTHMGGHRVANRSSRARNPAFDVTPARFIEGLITEKGVIEPTEENVVEVMEK